jgi:hypothetical protein
MPANATAVRMNYGSQKTPPPLPCSYELSSWYPDPGLLAPAKLDITATGSYINGKPITKLGFSELFDPFLNTWIKDSANSQDNQSDELALSWYNPAAPAGPFEWGTIEFGEDRSTLIGIAGRKDAHGNEQVCYFTGLKAAKATPPPAPPLLSVQAAPPAPPANLNEMITLTFPGLTQAACNALGDDFAWAMDQQWRSKLVAKDRPTIAAGLPQNFAQQRLQFLDAHAEWFNTTFGPASLGTQLYQDSLPNATNPVKLSKTLTSAQASQITTFLNGPLGNMAQTQQEHLLAARTAHFAQNSRLQLYINEAPAFLAKLNAVNGMQPSIVTFLGLMTQSPQFQSAGLKLTNRYAGLLGALDETGALEQDLRTTVIAVQLQHCSEQVAFSDEVDLTGALTDVLQQLLNDSSQQGTPVLMEIKTAVATVGSSAGLASQLAAQIYKAAKGAPSDGGRILRIAATTTDAFNAKFPAAKITTRTVAGLCLGYAVYMSVRMYTTWAQLSAADRAELIFTTFTQAISGISVVSDIGKAGYTLATKTPAEILADVKALNAAVDTTLDPATLKGKLNKLDPKLYEKANTFLSTLLKPGEGVEGKLTWVAEFVPQGLEIIGKVLGPVTAAAALAQSVYQLFGDIKSGAGVTKIALDSVNVAVDTALLVCAAIDLVVDVFAVTVIGIVLVALAIVVTAVVALIAWILGRRKPESPPDDYMEHVVYPFLALIPRPAPPSTLALKPQQLSVAWRGQFHTLPAAAAKA